MAGIYDTLRSQLPGYSSDRPTPESVYRRGVSANLLRVFWNTDVDQYLPEFLLPKNNGRTIRVDLAGYYYGRTLDEHLPDNQTNIDYRIAYWVTRYFQEAHKAQFGEYYPFEDLIGRDEPEFDWQDQESYINIDCKTERFWRTLFIIGLRNTAFHRMPKYVDDIDKLNKIVDIMFLWLSNYVPGSYGGGVSNPAVPLSFNYVSTPYRLGTSEGIRVGALPWDVQGGSVGFASLGIRDYTIQLMAYGTSTEVTSISDTTTIMEGSLEAAELAYQAQMSRQRLPTYEECLSGEGLGAIVNYGLDPTEPVKTLAYSRRHYQYVDNQTTNTVEQRWSFERQCRTYGIAMFTFREDTSQVARNCLGQLETTYEHIAGVEAEWHLLHKDGSETGDLNTLLDTPFKGIAFLLYHLVSEPLLGQATTEVSRQESIGFTRVLYTDDDAETINPEDVTEAAGAFMGHGKILTAVSCQGPPMFAAALAQYENLTNLTKVHQITKRGTIVCRSLD